jgi:hypothetical protein
MSRNNFPAVVCIGLGGTKIEIGLLTADGQFHSSGEILWRTRPEFARHRDATEVAGFCQELALVVDRLLDGNGFSWSDIGVVGVPFPGPRSGKLWYSNNLTRAFLDGVALEEVLEAALAPLTRGAPVPAVRVLLDAKCDAGGEIYHPEGRVYGAPVKRASVINVATGIAAGYACDGRILVSDEDFRTIGPDFDSGAGQLGRHLWHDLATGNWAYHYHRDGLTPRIPSPAIRMTDYLSGPAVAGRLLLHLGDAGALACLSGMTAARMLEEIYRNVQSRSSPERIVSVALTLRSAAAILAGSLLSWLDEAYAGVLGFEKRLLAETVADRVIADFAAALGAWLSSAGWREWVGPIVMTGGFGLRFLARSDGQTQRDFCGRLEKLMPPGVSVQRSRLYYATLREAYIFQRQ